jgi:hypothetical protein
MANRERNPLDEIARRVRDWMKELDTLLNPQQPQRARVPVPVRTPQDQRRNNYR